MINIGVIKDLSNAKKYLRNTVIVYENDYADDNMYIVLKGSIAFYRDYNSPQSAEISVYHVGTFFYEEVVFLNRRRVGTAVAVEDTILLLINRQNLPCIMQTEPELFFQIVKELCLIACDNNSNQYINLDSIMSDTQTSITSPNPETTEFAPKLSAKTLESSKTAQPLQASDDSKLSSTTLSQKSSLFPQQHGDYNLTLDDSNSEYLMTKAYSCPLCKHNFKGLKVKPSKLITESTDPDTRVHYKGIEPMYYEVITCPECLYSAFEEIYTTAKKPNPLLLSELKIFKPDFQIQTDIERNADTVFAGFYLALICAPQCFARHQLITARLFLKLSRIYADCSDPDMELKSAKQALDMYLYSYSHITLNPRQSQQICILIGELYLKLEDYANARKFFFNGKMEKMGTPTLKRHAEDRIEDIRSILA